jgi:hypothetical protein
LLDWFLVLGFWFLVSGCWLLVAGLALRVSSPLDGRVRGLYGTVYLVLGPLPAIAKGLWLGVLG